MLIREELIVCVLKTYRNMLNATFFQSSFFRYFSPLFVSFVGGSLVAFAMPPYHYIPLLFIGLSGFYGALLWCNSAKHAALSGFLFGFAFFLFGLEWIGNALLVEGNEFAWVWPLAICGLPTVLGLFYAVAAYTSYRLFNLRHVSGFFGFCLMLALIDWLRGHLFTGFPWNLFAYSWGEVLEVLQLLSIGNVYFLNIFSIGWASAPAFILFCVQRFSSKLMNSLILLVSFFAVFMFGSLRLQSVPTDYYTDQYVQIVQPNIQQADKWDPDKMSQHFKRLVDLSARDQKASIDNHVHTLVVWPETATSGSLLSAAENRRALSDALYSHGENTHLLTGIMTYHPNAGYGNSAVLFDRDIVALEKYNKTKLVPFGEFIPFQDWIPLTPVAKFKGFGPGSGSTLHNIPGGLRYRALVCYEVIFPGATKQVGADKPDILINITNDAWYGISAGPYQHFLHARYRAIESGIPIIRSANTGISTLIDGTGRILYQSILNTEKNYLTPIPKNTKVLSDYYIGQNALFMLICLIGVIWGISFRIGCSRIDSPQ